MDADPQTLVRWAVAIAAVGATLPIWFAWRKWFLYRESGKWPETSADVTAVWINKYGGDWLSFDLYATYEVVFSCRYRVGKEEFMIVETLPNQYRAEYAEQEAAKLEARILRVAYNPAKPAQAFMLPRSLSRAVWPLVIFSMCWVLAVVICLLELQKRTA